MRNTLSALALAGLLSAGMTGSLAVAQDSAPPATQSADQQGMNGQGMNGQGHRQMNPDQQLKHLSRTLNLSADQKNQIRPILEDRDQKMMQLRQDSSMSQQDRHQQMMSIMQDSHAKIEAVLNDEQKQKFEQMEQQRHSRMRDNNPQGDQNMGGNPQGL